MPKIVNYKCEVCGKEEEDLINDTEEPKDVLGNCSDCDGILKKFNFKNNCQVWRFNDRGGL